MARAVQAQRVVHGQIDCGGIYCSRVAAGGSYVFLASPAVDESGRLSDEARVNPPYHLSPSAQARAQTRYIFDRYKEGLEELGSSVNDIVQVEQWIQLKAHADGYLETSRGPGFMERGRPGSALLATGEFVPEECVVTPTGIAVIPGDGVGKEILEPEILDPGMRPEFGSIYGVEPPYNEIVTAGPYVFTVGDICSDYESGVHPDFKVADWIWWGNEVRSEAQFILDTLAKRLEVANSSLENAVHCTVYLTDIEDLYEVDLVWKQYFGDDPPARTVAPLRGLGLPRLEGARGHRQNALKMESMFQSIRPGLGVEKETVSTGVEPLAHEAEATRAGPLLWVSGQLAGGTDGLLTAPDTPSQLGYIFERLAAICEAGGTSLDNLLRVRAFVTDVRQSYAVYAALRKAVPSDPPCVAITGVPAPLQVPGCTVIVDAVAYVPG